VNLFLGMARYLVRAVRYLVPGKDEALRIVNDVFGPAAVLRAALTDLKERINPEFINNEQMPESSRGHVIARAKEGCGDNVSKNEIFELMLSHLTDEFVIEALFQKFSDEAIPGKACRVMRLLISAMPVERLVEEVVSKLRKEDADRSFVYRQMLPFFSERNVFSLVMGSLQNGALAQFSDELVPRMYAVMGGQRCLELIADELLNNGGGQGPCNAVLTEDDVTSSGLIEYIAGVLADEGVCDQDVSMILRLIRIFPDSVIYRLMSDDIKKKITGSEGSNEVQDGQIDGLQSYCSYWIKSSKTIEVAYSRIRPLLFDYTDIYASQEGEDILLKRLLKQDYNMHRGYYVDVGAYHPFKFSNTLHYYLRGWSGINIDPVPGMKEMFDEVRPRDINVEAGVSRDSVVLEYHEFKEPAFNTFSRENMEYAKTRSEYLRSIDVKTHRLDYLLGQHLDSSVNITFCNIDVEGMEMSVLDSNDWDKYRPKILLVENIVDLDNGGEVSGFLEQKGYLWVAQTKNTHFYVEQEYYMFVV
jgi:FkbM family methyltransferase